MIEFKLTKKQLQAYKLLRQKEPLELVFGGGARGGKTFLGCFWICSELLEKPKSAWLIGREELKALKRTTMRTFFEVVSMLGWKKDEHYHFNAQDMVFTLRNGSTVFFSELKAIPSDPQFDRLGSYDLTGYWIDEAQEVSQGAKETLKFRLSLLKGNGWEASPKALFTCNPRKNWIYTEFWKPLIKEKQKIKGKKFIVSLYTDNKHIDQSKYEKLKQGDDKVKIERLLYGNFEYDDTENKLFEYDKIVDMFTNRVMSTKDKYISADIARKGKDLTVIGLWQGLQLVKVEVMKQNTIKEATDKIQQLCELNGVPRSNVIVDADGLGAGVLDYLSGIKGFNNGSSPIQPLESNVNKTLKLSYDNLKTQCYFKLAELVNLGKVGITEIDSISKEKLIEELDVIEQVNVDSDKKLSIMKKEQVKEKLGRSPDFSDMMMMRMFFEIQVKPRLSFMPIM